MVRHGQASYMSEDYDRLSAIGEEQAIKLGEFWVRHEIRFDACFHGPAKRHSRTADIAAEVVKAAGLPWPETEIIEDVDEFDAFRLARLLTPRLVEVDPEIRKLNDDFMATRHTPEGGSNTMSSSSRYFTSAVASLTATTRVCSRSATHTAAVVARQNDARTVRWATRCRRPPRASAARQPAVRPPGRTAGRVPDGEVHRHLGHEPLAHQVQEPQERDLRPVPLVEHQPVERHPGLAQPDPLVHRQPPLRPVPDVVRDARRPAPRRGPRPTPWAGTGRRPAGPGTSPCHPDVDGHVYASQQALLTVARFTSTDPQAKANDFTATVNWVTSSRPPPS